MGVPLGITPGIRRIAAATALLIAAETAVVVATSGQAVALGNRAPAAQAEAPKPAGPAEAGDEASARLMARLQDRRIEILDARSEASTSWANPDGTVTVESFTGPVRVQDDSGRWRPVDTTLAVEDGKVVPTAAASEIAFSAGGASAPLAQVTRGEKTLGVAWEGTLPTPVLKGNTATYPGAVPGGDVVVTALPQGFSHSVVLHERPEGPVEFRLPVAAEGLTLEQTGDERLRWKDTRGKEIAAAPPPLMWDASTDAKSKEPEHTATVDAAVEKASDGQGQVLVLKPSKEFLSDPDLTYPVVVDPTNTLAGPTTDTWIQHSDYPTSQRGSSELKAGTYDGVQKARSYLKFDTAKYAGKKIVDTDLRLYSYYSSTCSTSGPGVEVRRITSDWDPAAISWSAQPSTTTAGAVTSTAAKGYSASCPAGHVSWDVDAIVQAWADGQPNHGLRLAGASESDPLTWRRYRSANYVSGSHDPNTEPSLTVTYNSYPAKPTAQAISPSQVNAYNGIRYVTSLTPQLSAKVSDPDGGTVRAQFEITPDPAHNDAGTYSHTGTSPGVASGSTATHTIPSASALPSGKSLRYRVRGYDGTLYGAWSGYTSFRLNTGKPAAPSIVCDPYTAQTWTAKAADGAQCTFDTTSTDGQGYYWGLNDPNTPSRINDTTDGTSGRPLTVTVKPGDGWHTLYAKTVDSGGNLSTSTTAYSFGVGDGAALLTPADGERPARRVTLSSKGKSDYTGVIYQYRRGETDTWHTVPAADTTRASDGSAVTWPLAVTGGEAAKLIWNITDTLTEDGPIDIRAAFTNGSVTGYSPANTVTVDRNADIAASTEIGPGYLNLLTGDFKIPGTEGSYFGLSASRTASSRQPTAGGDQSGQAAIFGDEWVSSAVAGMSQAGYTHIRKTSNTSLDVVLEDGSSIYFTAKAGDANGWVPEPRAESLTLTGAFAEGFTLTDTDGTESAFAKVAADAETWQITSSGLKGITNSTTSVVSEAVTVDGKTLARPKLLVASGGAIATKTCAQIPSTRGCRVLEFEYADTTTATDSALGDYRGQLKNLKLWSTEKSDTRATARTVQTYAYDTSGRLRETWNPQISPALKTAYDYDAAGRVTKVTPPGQLPWSLGYGNAGGTTAGDGMLTTVTRPTLQQGTASTTNGQAATSIVYDVPLSGDRAPYTMSASTVMKWGQLDFPTDATAVFPADTAPASHKGGELLADGYGRAVIHYLNTSGDEVNTIDEAGGVTTTEGDKHGNTVRQLTAGHHALALGTSDADRARLADLGISELSTAERARLLSTIMRYNSDGTRLLEQFKPLRRVDLTEDLKDGTTVLMAAGTSVIAQPWTVNEYDEGRPTDGSATVKDQLTMEISGARVLGYDSILADKRLTQTQYDWVKGLPVHSIEDPGGLDLVTTTEYDEQGRVTAHVPPGGTGQDASSRITTYWSAEGTGWCEGRPEWVGLECWNGPAGDITGGGDNPAQAVNTSTEYGFYGQMTEKTETSDGETRITTVTYDPAGRIKSTHIGGGLGTPVTGTSVAYDESNGQISVMMSEGGGVIYQKADALGRIISYTDADDAVTRTEYDTLDRPVKVSDSVPSTVTYTYDHGKEPRGLATSMTDSVAGTFTATYDVDGTVARQTLPGGHTMTQSGGKAGLPYQRAYTRDSDGTVLLTDIVTESIHEEWISHAGGAGVGESQSYTYDTIGRLTKVEDTYNNVCTTRTYGFDQRTNRTSLTTADAEAGAACTTSGGTQVTHAYDSADRIVDPGYTYDAFGRTTRMADGTSIAYYNNDLVQRQTSGHTRQSWTLDAAGRFRAWTTESDISGAWAQTDSKTNHYSSSSDSPRWITDNTDGSIARMVGDLAGAMSATTGVSGPVALQLANLHGDISLVLSLDESVAPTVLSSDEYGNRRSGNTARYSWLGTHQRSAETPSGAMLMGVRLYNPETGRFLSTDPVYGGSRNAYEYAGGNPVTNMDLDGRWYKKRTWYYSWGRLTGQYWSPSNWWSGSGHINLTAVFSKRWTGRVADYGWYSYLVVGAVGAIVAALFPAAVLAIVAITALVELSWGTIQLVATWARNRGQCLGITMGASIKHKWGVPRYAYSRYVSPWRFRC